MECPLQEKRYRASGLTTIELLIALSMFGVVLVSLAGLHLVALSTGTLAETSSIAMNLARGRMETLLALPRDQLRAQQGAEQRVQVPKDGGRVYQVRTTVAPVDPTLVDLVVTATWQVTAGAACAAARDGDCAGTVTTHSRTLQTRVQVPARP